MICNILDFDLFYVYYTKYFFIECVLFDLLIYKTSSCYWSIKSNSILSCMCWNVVMHCCILWVILSSVKRCSLCDIRKQLNRRVAATSMCMLVANDSLINESLSKINTCSYLSLQNVACFMCTITITHISTLYIRLV